MARTCRSSRRETRQVDLAHVVEVDGVAQGAQLLELLGGERHGTGVAQLRPGVPVEVDERAPAHDTFPAPGTPHMARHCSRVRPVPRHRLRRRSPCEGSGAHLRGRGHRVLHDAHLRRQPEHVDHGRGDVLGRQALGVHALAEGGDVVAPGPVARLRSAAMRSVATKPGATVVTRTPAAPPRGAASRRRRGRRACSPRRPRRRPRARAARTSRRSSPSSRPRRGGAAPPARWRAGRAR